MQSPYPPADAATGIAQAGGRTVPRLLFLVILVSPFVFIEPSPYDGAVLVLGFVAALLGLSLDRRLLLLLVLLMVWALGGAFALVPVLHDSRAVMYFVISFYLQLTAVLFACLFLKDTVRRLAVLENAYVLAALIAAGAGIIGYFFFPESILLENGRARGTFKDPNVFGPFLILPLLFVTQQMLEREVRMRHLAVAAVIMTGLFLSFSRGAWGHFLLSVVVMLALMLLTAASARLRLRVLTLAIVGAIAASGLLAALLSVDAVQEMFAERAELVQSYDAGPAGRFGKQIESLTELLDRPNGLGPEQFGKHFKQAPHNVYLNAFFAYGWLGGFAYCSLVVITLVFGFRALLVRTPWQMPLIAIYASFFGVVAEGFIIDTDHWRHYFLLLGLIWALIAATDRQLVRAHPVALAVRHPA